MKIARGGFIDTSYGGLLKQHPMLSREETTRLTRLAQAGDEDARNALVMGNLRLAASVVQRDFGAYLASRSSLLEADDLFQEALIGLARATQTYNPDSGFRFSTYATPWIRQSISRAIDANGEGVVMPVYLMDELRRAVTRKDIALLRECLRGFKIAASVWSSVARDLKVESMCVAELAFRLGFVGVTDDTLMEEVSDGTSMREDLLDLPETMREALCALSEREREVLCLSFGLRGGDPLNGAEVGRMLGVTRESVRQARHSALKKLRESAPELVIYCER